MTNYSIAERFKSIQGEGVYSGTPMAFIRFTGCSVGKRICHFCDTEFSAELPWQGGGTYSARSLRDWAWPYPHVCVTGGEPLDWDLTGLLDDEACRDETGIGGHRPAMFHIETSGTRDVSAVRAFPTAWLTVSPKPGWREDAVAQADEVKIIVPGLGTGNGWPGLDEAISWAGNGKIVYLQPRNNKHMIDPQWLKLCQSLVREHPQLRLSPQLHKLLGVA